MLEALACRWFYPSSTWHVVPKLDRVALQLNVTDRPALLSRVIWWGWGLKGLSRTHLWFYNCPNYLAVHAEDLLVPRDAPPRDD